MKTSMEEHFSTIKPDGLAFFGAFNPPTIGHLLSADKARKDLSLSEVLFVPSKSHYIEKTEGKDFAFSEEERLAMLLALSASRHWMKVYSGELQEERQPRTYDTLQKIFKETGKRYSLLFGSDKLMELETVWKHLPEIGKEFGFVVLSRSGKDTEKIIAKDSFLASLRPFMTLVEAPLECQGISSTKARSAYLKKDYKSLKEMVPEEILAKLKEEER
ncbi:MAG: nicotinate-nicotinamide nucleotide adenylyltransferase [Bacilli bacterium]|jgi:nicotinate-nucleotide adenylyltransferase|nr:nicotinate-nicotinamide nucleotide adenylyltransferase [Bacilli bacterium]